MKNIIYLWFLLLSPFALFGQVSLEENHLLSAVNESPQEKVFVHYNTSFSLAGEYLYYKIYALDKNNLTPSAISKTAYVELRDRNGKSIFLHKVALNNGTGEGDFFISTEVPSGNYKLLGYTKWMLNGEMEEIFQGDLVVVNPYTNEQEQLLASSENVNNAEEQLITNTRLTSGKNTQDPSGNRETYGKRELVEIKPRELRDLDPLGDYSVSVRKVRDIEVPKMTFSEDILGAGNAQNFRINSGEKFHLPELRGEIFTGKIKAKEGAQVNSVANRSVLLSIPDQNFILEISRTNERGEFLFNVENYNTGEEVFLQVLGEGNQNFDIQLDPAPKADKIALSFANFKLTPAMEEMIVEESVYNQIENGYFSVKPDTVKIKDQFLPFYGDRMVTYNLGDYTRFNTVPETLVEIIRDFTTGKEDGKEVLRMRGDNPLVNEKTHTLLIVDGIAVQDHAKFIHYPAKKIKTIGVLRDKYFYGPEVFYGIIKVETIEGNFEEQLDSETVQTASLLRPQPEKHYFKQSYSSEDLQERTPDFRRQLLWDPAYDPKKGKIAFYTSDVPGEYEVILQGFTSSGKGVTLTERFLVK